MAANPWFLPGPGSVPDLVVVRQALGLLVAPEAGFQLTCAPSWAFATFPGTGAGIDRAVAWVATHGGAEGIYCALNPVEIGLDVRVHNADVLFRRWLLIDVDRTKSVEDKKLSATAEQHENALALAESVREYLLGQGWPEPALHVDSGNGAHLLYRINWPNDPASQKALAAFLKELAAQFDGPFGMLDRAVHDARRIVKLPGTWARKGPATTERPHRMAQLLSMSATPDLVSLPLVQKLVQKPHPEVKNACSGEVSGVSVSAFSGDTSPWTLRPPSADPAEIAWARQALASECDRMRRAQPGDLNNQLFRSAAALGNIIATGLLGEREVVDALLAAGEDAGCDSPAKDRATVARGITTGTKTPRRPQRQEATSQPQGGANPARPPAWPATPPFRAFPVNALPDGLRELVAVAAKAIGCCPSMVALPGLAVVAACIGNAYQLRVKGGWFEPAIIWAVVIGDSGTLKSPAYRAATKPLFDLQADEADRFQAAKESHEVAMRLWKDAGKEGPEPQKPAAMRRHVTADATIEAIGEILERQTSRKGILVARDEVDGWFQGFTRYKGKGGGNDRSQWLELAQAATLTIDRKTDSRTIIVRRASASVTGTIQPQILENALDMDALASGLAARLLMTQPPRRKRVWTEDEIPDAATTAYQNLLKNLLGKALKDTDARLPNTLKMTAGCKAIWLEFFRRWSDIQFRAEGAQAAALAKLEGYAVRLALIHHVTGAIARGESVGDFVLEESMQAAVALVKWFRHETDRIYATLREPAELRELRRLLDWIKEQGGMTTASKLHRSNKIKYRTTEDADGALDDLARKGFGTWQERPLGKKGGRKTRDFKMRGEPEKAETETPETFSTDDENDPDEDDFPEQGLVQKPPPIVENAYSHEVSGVSVTDFSEGAETRTGDEDGVF